MSLPKDQRNVSRIDFGSQNPGVMGGHQRLVKSSTNDGHPYLKPYFWKNPTNQFWESDLFTEKAKEYFRASLL